MKKTASVFVNIPVKSIAKAYSYIVPEEFSFLTAGWRVFVPFGSRKVEGFVVEIQEGPPGFAAELKPILELVDQEAWFSPPMLQTAYWLADYYLCSVAESMRLFMPGKSGLKIRALYYACGNSESEKSSPLLQVQAYKKLYTQIQLSDGLDMQELRQQFSPEEIDLDYALRRLLQFKLIYKDYAAKRNASQSYEKIICLRPDTGAVPDDFSRRPAQKRLLEILLKTPVCSAAFLRQEKVSWPVIHALEEQGLIEIRSERILQDSYRGSDSIGKSRLELTAAQKKALGEIVPLLEACQSKTFLLHGVTGSGKTQVYMEAARTARAQGRQVVVLVPEIALTGQLVSSFKYYFPEDILVIHSRLSLSERNDAVFRLRQQQIGIVIGARSALFMPFDDLGLLILDEEHDPSYKQDESPRYHARDVAEEMARLHNAVLLLGSATPAVESFYRAEKKDYTLLSLPQRIGNLALPQVQYVDMRTELKAGNRNVISRELRQLLETTVAKGEQAIIMLNRRGFSTFVMCRSCGEVIKCKDCGLPLVYHKSGRLQCHHCDLMAEVPDLCPKCSSRYIKYFGTGTERLEQELQQLLPAARIIRMDRDTTGRKFAHTQILEQFKQKKYDILLGTQMVAKGHDIPNVTAVGIISADSSLNMPDFRAAERCFMLITQTAGRAGRGKIPGKVIVQTYNPEHYAVQCGIRQDYAAFYREELGFRQVLQYPPFSSLIKLLVQHKEESTALEEATALVERFRQCFSGDPDEQIIGPAPAMIANFRGIYRFNLLIKTKNLSRMRKFMQENELNLKTNIMIDINPLNTI